MGSSQLQGVMPPGADQHVNQTLGRPHHLIPETSWVLTWHSDPPSDQPAKALKNNGHIQGVTSPGLAARGRATTETEAK